MKKCHLFHLFISLILSMQLFGQDISGVYSKIAGKDDGDVIVIKKICDTVYFYTILNQDSSSYFDKFAHFGILNRIHSNRFYGKINEGYLLYVHLMKDGKLSITNIINSRWKNLMRKSNNQYKKTKDTKFSLSLFDSLDYYIKGSSTYSMYYAFQNGQTMDVYNLPFECSAHSISIQKGDSLKVFALPNLMDVERNTDVLSFVELIHGEQKTAFWIMPTKEHPILAYDQEKGLWTFEYSMMSDGKRFTTDTTGIH